MVPTFDLPELSVPVAIGVAIVVGYLTQSVPKDTDSGEWESVMHWLFVGTFKPAMALFFGWIVFQFV